jgi:hypothetical protein
MRPAALGAIAVNGMFRHPELTFANAWKPNPIRTARVGLFETPEVGVSTIAVSDWAPEFETAVWRREFGWKIVERYATPEEACDGHARWMRRMLAS